MPDSCVSPLIFAFPAGRAVDRLKYFLRLPFERLGCAVFLFVRLFFFGVIYVPLYASGFFCCVGPYGRYSRRI